MFPVAAPGHRKIDCGLAVHPNAVKAQLEGGTIDGLSTALGLEITVENGQVQQSNFDAYPLARIAAFPARFETHILPYDDIPTGEGEIGFAVSRAGTDQCDICGEWSAHPHAAHRRSA